MVPVHITCRDFPLTAALRKAIRAYAESVEKFYGRVIRVEVVVSLPHKHRKKGRVFHVSARTHMPGQDLVVSRASEADSAHENLHLALHDAFRAMDRRLEDRVRRMSGRVNRKAANPRGRVMRIFPDEGFGFVRADDGRQIYFHRNSLLAGQFDHLKTGTKVQLHVEEGEDGPQASSLHVVRRQSRAAPAVIYPYVRKVG